MSLTRVFHKTGKANHYYIKRKKIGEIYHVNWFSATYTLLPQGTQRIHNGHKNYVCRKTKDYESRTYGTRLNTGELANTEYCERSETEDW